MPALRLHLPRLHLDLHLNRAAAFAAMTCILLACLAATASAAQPWTAPLRPVHVTRAFAPPPNPYAAGHRGVDLAGHVNQAVFASDAGRVSYAAELAGRGVVVVVHGSLRTTYEPVNAMVRRGEQVRRGQQIGRLEAGHAGCPVRACLHWGLLRAGNYLNPMSMLLGAQVRLLPLTTDGPSVVINLESTSAALPSKATSAVTASSLSSLSSPGPSPIAWSVAALAGGGMFLALRRR